MREVRRRHVRVVAARAGRAFRVGRLRVAVLWPDGPGFPGEDPNLRATILLVSYGQVDLLLTADAESPVTLPLDPPPVEILKVAHHGSADEGLPELLERLRPKVAVISVGLGNDYGHPTPSTLVGAGARAGASALPNRPRRTGRRRVRRHAALGPVGALSRLGSWPTSSSRSTS